MDNLAHVEVERETIRRAHGDRRQPFVQLVRLALARGPVEHDVGRGHNLNLVRVRVDGILARIERVDPHAFLALLHQVAVLERVAALVHSLLAHISDHHADVGDGHFGHRLNFDRGKARIDEVSPGQDHLFLQSLVPAILDKDLAILEHVVAGSLLAGNLAGGKRRAVLGGHNAHLSCRESRAPRPAAR